MSYTMGPPESDYDKLQRANQRVKELEDQCAQYREMLEDIHLAIDEGERGSSIQAMIEAMQKEVAEG
jgi:Tfp pilus assembly protein PilN